MYSVVVVLTMCVLYLQAGANATPVDLECKFRCAETQACILESWICDGSADCSDASDETNCTGVVRAKPLLVIPSCTSEQFMCDQTCVPGTWKCDGSNDCTDKSDEEGCQLEGLTNGMEKGNFDDSAISHQMMMDSSGNNLVSMAKEEQSTNETDVPSDGDVAKSNADDYADPEYMEYYREYSDPVLSPGEEMQSQEMEVVINDVEFTENDVSALLNDEQLIMDEDYLNSTNVTLEDDNELTSELDSQLLNATDEYTFGTVTSEYGNETDGMASNETNGTAWNETDGAVWDETEGTAWNETDGAVSNETTYDYSTKETFLELLENDTAYNLTRNETGDESEALFGAWDEDSMVLLFDNETDDTSNGTEFLPLAANETVVFSDELESYNVSDVFDDWQATGNETIIEAAPASPILSTAVPHPPPSTTSPPTLPPTTTTTTMATTTTEPSTTTHNPCNRDEFHCEVASSYEAMCIPVEWRCDNLPDCLDGSDEQDCQSGQECPSDMVKCPDLGNCIYGSWICDGVYDCENGSDELYCSLLEDNHSG